MNFRNSHYSTDPNITSVSGELFTIIVPDMANNLRLGFIRIKDPVRRIPGGQAFPFIEILEFEGATPLYYMTMGNELFSVGNELSNNVFHITNEFSWFTGKHNLTFGVNFEYMTFEMPLIRFLTACTGSIHTITLFPRSLNRIPG
jgi:hypothetical protein